MIWILLFVILLFVTTSGAVTRISNNREWEPEKGQNKDYFLEIRPLDPAPVTDEDIEVAFPNMQPAMDSQLSSPPASPISQSERDYTVILTMVI